VTEGRERLRRRYLLRQECTHVYPSSDCYLGFSSADIARLIHTCVIIIIRYNDD